MKDEFWWKTQIEGEPRWGETRLPPEITVIETLFPLLPVLSCASVLAMLF